MPFLDADFLTTITHQIKVYRSAAIVFPLVEKTNVEYLVAQLAESLEVSVVNWDFLGANLSGHSTVVDLSGGFLEQLLAIPQHFETGHLYVLENLQAMLVSSEVEVKELLRQNLVRMISRARQVSSYMLLLDDHGCCLPKDLQQLVPEHFFPLPRSEQIGAIIAAHGLTDSRLVTVAGGLSAAEVELGLQLAIESGTNVHDYLLQFKIDRLKRLGLEFLAVPKELSFGGLDIIRERLQGIKQDFSPKARRFNIPLPRGWLFVGPPGTGKTHAAKCIAHELSLPLISVGIDAIQSGGVNRFKELLVRLERIVCIVYFDELDKFFDESTDSQILGLLLTWMQEKTSDNFLIATLNRLSKIRPEVMRAGRVDDVFWVGFPQNNEKYEILRLYASKYDPAYHQEFGRLSQEEWITLMNLTMNFTGSELKLLVETAVRNKFHALFDRLDGEGHPNHTLELFFIDFKGALASVISLYSRDTEGILNIQNQAKKVSTPSSSPDRSIFQVKDRNIFGG